MNQIKNIVRIAVLSIILVKCSNSKSITKTKTNSLPNIIYILADDLGYGDLSITGQQKFSTPNIDQLAKNGMLFTQHYSGSTVCAPYRSSLLTGQHTGHTFIRGNKSVQPEGQFPLSSSSITVAEVLKTKGYVTGAFGKWGLGTPSSEGDPNKQGFDVFYGYNCQRIAHNYYPYHLWDNQTKILLEGNKESNTEVYAPEIIHNKALEFIQKNKDTSFFMYYPSIIPHAELAAPEKYMKKFRGKLLPEKSYRGIDSGKRYKNGGYGSQKEPNTAFAAMMYLLDEQVGDIRKKIEELGIAKNTLIIFTSDNGPHNIAGKNSDFFNSNGKFRGYKRDLYEGGIRVPMIAYWPETIKPNTTSKHISAFWDFFPTVCDITQTTSPIKTDGISFFPELIGKKQKKHKFLYWEFLEKGGKQAVRINNWKGIRLNMTNNPKAPIELYDLTLDNGEQNNIATKHPEIVKQITDIMNNQHTYSEVFHFKYEK